MKDRELTRDLLFKKIDQADRIHTVIVTRMHNETDRASNSFGKNINRLFKIDSMIESLHSFRRAKKWNLST